MQAPSDSGPAGAMHPVSHPALHAAPPLLKHPLLSVQGTPHLLCLVAVVTEASKASQQHTHFPAVNSSGFEDKRVSS